MSDVESEKVKIQVIVRTKDTDCAGTDANVFVTLKGEQGETGKMELKTSENHLNKFERGQIDVFHHQIAEIGTVTAMRIEHDNKGLGSSWCVDYVEIHFPHRVYHFDVDRWMEKGRVDTTSIDVDYTG
ncbi:Oidioi.mRNA.OKI2018_I69.chr2.g7623.t1.cds [Oikopleura dioica]|uniref:Oidioi.mRNA.OKI2018_I69.chr2.g7623.t1.cds n=1 Tax=Oikopleura dioica TaxID=34765 RepID=A0ABN7TAC8_OIKDI|nr:Oidioi.mRNA.OKI2018_I69.chr2.g7623.t1.cds [Oikopleura dioica]